MTSKEPIEKATMIENPLSPGIRDMLRNIRALPFDGANSIPSLFLVLVYVFVLVVLIICWPYGILTVITYFLWAQIRVSRLMMKGKKVFEKMPYTVAIGFYFLIWIPFAISYLPILIIGWLGSLVAGK